jgi:hypothetical protein
LNRALTRTVGTLGLMSAATAGAPSGPPAAGSDASVEAHSLDHGRSPIAVTSDGRTVVLAVVHRLDEATGGALLDAASAAVSAHTERIDVDLRSLESYTDAGARALVSCRDLCAHLPEGLHYRTGRGPGRDALMAAYTDVPAPDAGR